MNKDIVRAGNAPDHVFSSNTDVNMLPSQSTNDRVWQSHASELPADTLQKIKLVQLLKQINPDLHVCPTPNANSFDEQVKPTLEKGIQVPDTRFQQFGPKKPKLKGAPYQGYVGPGIRIQPRYMRPIRDRSHLAIWRESPLRVQDERRQSFNIYNKDAGMTSKIGFLKSGLRPDAPPHVPRSIRERNQSVSDYSVTNDSADQFDESVEESGSYVRKYDEENIKKSSSYKGEDKEKNKKKPSDADEAKTGQENPNETNKNITSSSGDDDSVVVVLNEPKEENELQRKTGQFFCRRCLRGWSSRNVWCVRGTSKVYIKQTCNTCNKVVNPYLVIKVADFVKSNQSRAVSIMQ